jgi:ribosomal protein S18 acetylase RimI-like enzyme
MSTTTVKVTFGPAAREQIHFLDDRIYEYNAATAGRDDGSEFSIVIRDAADDILAGIAGWSWAQACEITLLWVHADHRNAGHGTKLLQTAEAEIIERGCKTIVVRSYDFQAPTYYEKHGYVVHDVIDGFPAGGRQYTLIKRIP